ncbi:hypothetical protein EG878_16205, partial [Enterococcus faecalis]
MAAGRGGAWQRGGGGSERGPRPVGGRVQRGGAQNGPRAGTPGALRETKRAGPPSRRGGPGRRAGTPLRGKECPRAGAASRPEPPGARGPRSRPP